MTVDPRFNGPPSSAHGGYLCGRLAAITSSRHGPDVVVTLLAPAPLATRLLVRGGPRRTRVLAGEQLVATVAPDPRGITAPPFVRPGVAAAASAAFAGRAAHPFPTCFVCGPHRSAGDGLRLAPGPVDGTPGTVACLWEATADAAGPDPRTLLWAVLDCPGGWLGDPGRTPMLLSRMSARILRLPQPGRAHVVVAALRDRSGRTLTNTSAVYDTSGALLASAQATWTACGPADGPVPGPTSKDRA